LDRRSFVASLAACPPALLALTKAKTGRSTAHPPWWNDTVLVGLGSAGFGVACLLDRHDAAPVNLMGFMGQRAWRPLCGNRETWLHRALRGPQGALVARQQVNWELTDFRERRPYTVIVVGLGGVTGSMLIGPLLEQLTEESSVHVVATMPLKFEGRRRERRAAEALAAIHWSDASLSITDLEMAKDETRPVGSYGDFLRRMDRRLAGEVVRAVAERSRYSFLKPDGREAGFGG
jgi:hypothetical protein